MNHNLEIVVILAVGFVLASLFAYITQKLKLSAIPGYLLAGFVIGPYSPGYVADTVIAEQLAEIGVVLMLFGVGLHFKLEDLINVKHIAIPGAAGQTLVATLLSIVLVWFVGWPLETGLIIGLAIGVASTVVLVRVLTDNHLLDTQEGHVAVGWLVVEDIFTVIILLLMPPIAGMFSVNEFSFWQLSTTLTSITFKFLLLALFMFTWGHRIIGYILTKVARMHSQEMFTLAVLALIFSIAVGSTFFFGTTIGLGAFVAGMVIGKTHVRHQAAAQALPLKDIFAIIFFLSVGMIFNPVALSRHWTLFIGLLAIILIFKPLAAYLITIFLGTSMRVALTVAIALAQIGEFSFILAEEALKFDLLPEDGYDMLVGCALVSISLNPLFFNCVNYLEHRLKKMPWAQSINGRENPLQKNKYVAGPRAVVVGYGPIGKSISAVLRNAGYTPIVIEQNIDSVIEQNEHEVLIYGDAADSSILKEASIDKSDYLLITAADSHAIPNIVHTARQINPEIQIISQINSLVEKRQLDDLGIIWVCSEGETLKSFSALVYHFVRSSTNQPRQFAK